MYHVYGARLTGTCHCTCCFYCYLNW